MRFILPFGAASASDTAARLFADRLSGRWGKPVVVENRPGGDGLVSLDAFVGAHDDHTLLFAPTSTFTAHTILHSKLPWKMAFLNLRLHKKILAVDGAVVFVGGLNIALCDGSARMLGEDISILVLYRMLTYRGRERVTDSDFGS